MATEVIELLQDIAEKLDNGEMGRQVPFSSSFKNTVDTREGKTHYTLAQFFDHYMNFMQNADFIYYGSNEPTNKHIKIWIDTSKSASKG